MGEVEWERARLFPVSVSAAPMSKNAGRLRRFWPWCSRYGNSAAQ